MTTAWQQTWFRRKVRELGHAVRWLDAAVLVGSSAPHKPGGLPANDLAGGPTPREEGSRRPSRVDRRRLSS